MFSFLLDMSNNGTSERKFFDFRGFAVPVFVADGDDTFEQPVFAIMIFLAGGINAGEDSDYAWLIRPGDPSFRDPIPFFNQQGLVRRPGEITVILKGRDGKNRFYSAAGLFAAIQHLPHLEDISRATSRYDVSFEYFFLDAPMHFSPCLHWYQIIEQASDDQEIITILTTKHTKDSKPMKEVSVTLDAEVLEELQHLLDGTLGEWCFDSTVDHMAWMEQHQMCLRTANEVAHNDSTKWYALGKRMLFDGRLPQRYRSTSYSEVTKNVLEEELLDPLQVAHTRICELASALESAKKQIEQLENDRDDLQYRFM